MENKCIKCDVTRCKHNNNGQNCSLSSIKVTCCTGSTCTCCGSYDEENY